jgi:hypothetical protein
VKVTFDTETDSYEQALAMLRVAYSKDSDDPEPLTGTVIGNKKPAGQWTRARLESFARGLDPTTTEAIRYIAAHAPAAPVAATLEHVSNYMFSLRMMSRFGQRDEYGMPLMFSPELLTERPGIVIPDGPDSPVTRDDANRVYRMDPAVSTIVTELLGPPAPDRGL